MSKDSRYVEVEGNQIKITNPEKLLFPKANISKWEYVLTCAKLAPFLLPYCKDRLLTTIRFPHGVNNGEYFYQKNVPLPKPDWVVTHIVNDTEYILLNNISTLIWLANLACLEFHVSFNQITEDYLPTELVFDLDPSYPDFSKVIDVALEIRKLLLELKLDGFVKTSGGTGLQIYVPIVAKYTFTQTRVVNAFFGRYLSKKYPTRITVERMVKKRGSKVYFDYLQHWHQKTLIAPYSTRGVDAATISTPLTWSELPTLKSPKEFTVDTIFKRLEKVGDLFKPVHSGQKYCLDHILDFIEDQEIE